MSTCKLTLDQRVKDKNGEFNLAVEVNSGKHKCFLNISKMNLDQYNNIFTKNSSKLEFIEFRKKAQDQVYRAEKIMKDMEVFDRLKLRELFSLKESIQNKSSTLKIEDLFEKYFQEKSQLSIRTKNKMKQSKNSLVKDHTDLNVSEINKSFLEKFERTKLNEGRKISYINGIFRDVRTVINYFTKTNKLIPTTYKYPFAYDGYKICEHFPKKEVLSSDNIAKFLNYNDYKNSDEEYAHNIWELLYLCNGINFADLFRLRWDQKKSNCFVFFRKKTQNTRKNHKQEIVVPITDRVQKLLDKVGDKESSFVLGKLLDGFNEQQYENKIHKYRGKINKKLKLISTHLELPIVMNLASARDCYATVLKRSGVSTDVISDMLAHSNTTVTKHYLGSIDFETVFEVNKNLI